MIDFTHDKKEPVESDRLFYIIRVFLKEGKQFMIWKLYLSIGFIFTVVTLWEILNIIRDT